MLSGATFVTQIRLRYLNYFGATLSPFDAYLALVGIKTLSERVAKQVSNAQKVIAYLEHSPHVAWVKHPSVKSSPYTGLGKSTCLKVRRACCRSDSRVRSSRAKPSSTRLSCGAITAT
ncbi:PLP-dependent transferase [Treponema endosymbiont of Eucomonympha sp.]|uniref:PLP-dependent transferase n=1 Tax=Treponema endosymbiont of Eucomonympha sp. TaxID=1580831 RepID=UPI0035A0CD20